MENPPKVLIAEDDAVLRHSLERTFEREGGSSWRGAAAVQAVEEHQPEIALLDISMPVLNGLEAAQKLPKSSPP